MSHVGCPIGAPSRVVKVPAMRPAHNQGESDAKKYLFLQRSAARRIEQQPSPAQMQEMYAAFNAWKEKFKDNILDMGGKLDARRQGRDDVGRDGRARLSRPRRSWAATCSSPPTASSARSRSRGKCPMLMPGSSIEIREVAGP